MIFSDTNNLTNIKKNSLEKHTDFKIKDLE